jgi:lysozyme
MMTGILARGIDVSHWSKNIDWDKVITQNVHFAFAKASELLTKGKKTVNFKDPMFDIYWRDLGARNIKRGAYHFCRPGMDPEPAPEICTGR